MASSIGAAVYGKPTSVSIPKSLFSGSTSGIGGQSTETVKKYDPTFGFSFTYVPGSKMFTKIGGYNYNGPTGNWGQRTLTKVNLRKQVQGAAGYLSADPMARIKHTKFITMNYGLQVVDPFLPRGGSVPRVVDTSNTEDPRAFYSDYNWGNSPQYHDKPGGDYYTIPPNTGGAPDDYTEDLTSTFGQPVDDEWSRESFEHMNPMSGRNGMGFDPVMAAMVAQKLENLTGAGASTDLLAQQSTQIIGNSEFARRRAASLTQLFQNSTTLQDTFAQAGTQANNLTGSVGTIAGGSGKLGGMETDTGPPTMLRSNETGEALPALIPESMQVDKKNRKQRRKNRPPPPALETTKRRVRSGSSTPARKDRPKSFQAMII